METNDSTLIEVLQTLEQIKLVNERLAFHRSFEESDTNAIHNFERLKANFLSQLAILLNEFDVKLNLPIAA
ncbi:MAG: hypothetical protein EAZ32_18005 [Cytophagia bacterium]|nr:MAG: hypothetical protein EAZ46_11725 [Runella sp.]TAG16430.1 MAG: hypothetical protein EAZ38_18770 [Cytophagales bacterium]TAG35727.1 MAG: hypothetical protein EAZ32_18005 [Cytophagia bacterium]TAG58890.1 MAG: hypothetical protein EAZ29_00305 [Runella slithyformis]TAG77444.1 MAG: hypothetical protein EAZ22_15630 [Cytophagales bacterium]